MAAVHVLRNHVAPGLRGLRIEPVLRRIGRQEGIHRLLRRYTHRLERMRDVERVVAHHHRQQHLLGDAERQDRRVQRFLRALGIELDPAGVALREAVGLVRPECPGRGHGAVDVGHHDRRARAARIVQQLVHQQQALRGGGGEHAHARQRGGNARRHHRVLGFGRDDLGVELAVGLEFGQLLEHRRLRRDRIDRHHLGPCQSRCPRECVVASHQHRSALCTVSGRLRQLDCGRSSHLRDHLHRPGGAFLHADAAALAVVGVDHVAGDAPSGRRLTARSGQ